MMIDDMDVKKPDNWKDDAPLKIADPKAEKPDDWDDSDDGEWEAPVIDNPVCKDSKGANLCGEWKRPKKKNPDYKGKWSAPMIDNPKYKGVWKAKQIANPDFFETETPLTGLADIMGIGIDVWTMVKGIGFDNFYIGPDPEAAWAFSEKSFKIKQEHEGSKGGKTNSSFPFADLLSDHPIPIAATVAALLLTTLYFCFCGSSAEDKALDAIEREETEEKTDDVADDDDGDQSEDPVADTDDGEETPGKKPKQEVVKESKPKESTPSKGKKKKKNKKKRRI